MSLEERKQVISDKTAVSFGVVGTLLLAAVSWGVMFNKVGNLEENLRNGDYDKRVTVLETTLPQIQKTLEKLSSTQDAILEAIKPTLKK